MEGKEIKNITAQKVNPGTGRSFIKDPVAMTGFIIIALSVIIAVLGYQICPDKSPNANTQYLELAGKNPGFKVNMLRVRRQIQAENPGFLTTMISGRIPEYEKVPFLSYTFEDEKILLREYTDYPEKEIYYYSYSIPSLFYDLDPGQPAIYRGGSDKITFILRTGEKVSVTVAELRERVEKEALGSQKFILGTDRFGRDLLSRIILGSRISLLVGFIAVSISLVIGLTLGVIAGYYRGWTDNAIMWLINVVWSIPTLLLVIALTMVIGKGFWQVFVAVGVTMWVEVARLVRGQVLGIREKEYVDAARVLGYSDFRILAYHILPNVISPVIIISAANFASAILIEAGLSFLGIGVQPPVPSWGSMVREHYGFILAGKAYLAFVPGFAIMLMVLAFTMAGNGLRDSLDVRYEQKT